MFPRSDPNFLQTPCFSCPSFGEGAVVSQPTNLLIPLHTVKLHMVHISVHTKLLFTAPIICNRSTQLIVLAQRIHH